MDKRLYGNYMVGKIDNKFYVFYTRASLGGVCFSEASEPFHTAEAAHEWLLDMCAEDSTPSTKLMLIEVVKDYMLIGEEQQQNVEYEVGIEVEC